jgi:hypoxanthine phosphoribosyltransferase
MSLITSTAELKDFDYIVAITRGGLIPAFLIARITDIRLVDTFICQSYNDDHSRGNIKYTPKDMSHLKGKKVLIVDELVETGDTLKFAVEEISKYNPELIKTFVVFRKDITEFEPDYYVQEAGQSWIDFKYDEVELEGIINYIAIVK